MIERCNAPTANIWRLFFFSSLSLFDRRRGARTALAYDARYGCTMHTSKSHNQVSFKNTFQEIVNVVSRTSFPEHPSSCSRQYSVRQFRHLRMVMARQSSHVLPQPQQSRCTPRT